MMTAESGVHKKYDVFISHASKDKLAYVNNLREAVVELGINIFYDSKEISWGDNWKQAIYNGINNSEFAIIVISKNFFSGTWTEIELQEFFDRQNESGQKIILPLLYDVSIDEFKTQYPKLAEIQCIEVKNDSYEEIVICLAKELIKRYKESGRADEKQSVASKEFPAPDLLTEQDFLLLYAAESNGKIIRSSSSGRTNICAGGREFMKDESPREIARWNEVLDNLVKNGWVRVTEENANVFDVTQKGFLRADEIKERDADFDIILDEDPKWQLDMCI